jgi:hypothetical protein
MNLRNLYGCFLLLLLTLAVPNSRGASGEPEAVLMIGNSLTYTYEVPRILMDLAAGSGKKLSITPHVAGGKSLSWHWTNPSGKDPKTAAEAIAAKPWDLVILQEGSRVSSKPDTLAEFNACIPGYVELVGKNKATRLMFYTGFVRKPDVTEADIKPVEEMYRKQAETFQLTCAPTVRAFLRCRERAPKLALLDDQTELKYAQNKTGTHQSPFGSYLAACTLYAAIYDQTPVGNPARKSGEGIVIDDEDALLAQEVAWATWSESRGK